MKTSTKLFSLILLLFVISCNNCKKEKIIIPKQFYNIKITEDDSTKDPFYSDLPGMVGCFQKYYLEHDGSDCKFMYADIDTLLNFQNDELEIEYSFMLNTIGGNPPIPRWVVLDVLIGKIAYDTLQKYPHCFYIIRLFKKNNFNLEDKTKDSIYTNLPDYLINRIYPEFNGIIMNGNITEIRLNYNKEISDEAFYRGIQLVGFNRFFKTREDALVFMREHNMFRKN